MMYGHEKSDPAIVAVFLLVVPLLAAAVSVWIATQVEDMREHLKLDVGAFP